MQKHKR